MAKNKGYILVEGHGEEKAVQNLIVRLSLHLGVSLRWTKPRRWVNLHQWEAPRHGGILGGTKWIRTKPDAAALLIVRDEDDQCPGELAPKVARKLRELKMPVPVAYVLMHPEYEVLFLPCLEKMGFPPWDGASWESHRGIKEWLSRQLPRGRSYKPTVDQLPLTRLIDFHKLRDASVPSFGSLERSLLFLHQHQGVPGAVYP